MEQNDNLRVIGECPFKQIDSEIAYCSASNLARDYRSIETMVTDRGAA